MVPWIHTSLLPPNGISIGSTVFAQLTPCAQHTDTHKDTDHATCGICSNKPYICTAPYARGLIKNRASCVQNKISSFPLTA